jgi:hypothetical protein
MSHGQIKLRADALEAECYSKAMACQYAFGRACLFASERDQNSENPDHEEHKGSERTLGCPSSTLSSLSVKLNFP